MDSPGEDFERGYLDRYRGEDGEIDPDEVGQTAIDRLLFVADNISGGEEKSYLAHLVASAAELLVASTAEEQSQD
jgi:hypothetical protein